MSENDARGTWRASSDDYGGHRETIYNGPYLVCVMNDRVDAWREDRDRIVHEHNSHADLLAACRRALAMPDGVPVAEWEAARVDLRAAIAKAEGSK